MLIGYQNCYVRSNEFNNSQFKGWNYSCKLWEYSKILELLNKFKKIKLNNIIDTSIMIQHLF